MVFTLKVTYACWFVPFNFILINLFQHQDSLNQSLSSSKKTQPTVTFVWKGRGECNNFYVVFVRWERHLRCRSTSQSRRSRSSYSIRPTTLRNILTNTSHSSHHQPTKNMLNSNKKTSNRHFLEVFRISNEFLRIQATGYPATVQNLRASSRVANSDHSGWSMPQQLPPCNNSWKFWGLKYGPCW